MNTTKLGRSLMASAGVLCSASVMYAAQVSFSTNPPTQGPNDISNLTGAKTESENVNGGDHDATYIADDRPIQGQTFTTGKNAAGYEFRSITLREVRHETYALVPYLKYTIRVTHPSGNSLEILATEQAEVAPAAPGNFSTTGDGNQVAPGSGRFITFTFEKPVILKPNIIYGFDVGAGSARHYWQMDGTSANAYAGGEAYSSGSAGIGTGRRWVRTGDRVFVVSLTEAEAPIVSETKRSPEGKRTGQ